MCGRLKRKEAPVEILRGLLPCPLGQSKRSLVKTSNP